MFTPFSSFFQRVLSGEAVEHVGSKTKSFTKPIYRDELSKKQSPIKKKNHFSSTEKPVLKVHKDEKASSNNIRVKVKMSKQEAARLLSKCKDGGVLEFRDVAREIVDLPVGRVSILSTFPAPATNGLLDSIPEE